MDDLKQQMQHHFLSYASYVILDRAIPHVDDGLKPVQRRILHTLKTIDDGKLHKVANVVGQTMAYHPHGDAAIKDALVALANKLFLLDMQGNFGNLYTGDPAAAARYIETRLSELSKETMFNPDLTDMVPSYDGRNKEPVVLPAKIPLLLMQGAEGIAVGMSTRILPHNFTELLEAEIAFLEGKDYILLPDFYMGGMMDASDYDKGKGKVRLRARMESPDPKTLLIKEICFGTTTESVIRSVDEAAKKGKIKIDSINDYTAEKVEIEIKLPRGQYAEDLIDSLYAYTDCEVSISTQPLVIKDNLPWETDVHQVLEYHTTLLKGYLKRELEIERDRLLDKIFLKSLERIFIENRMYKKIESLTTYEKIHASIETSLKPFHKELFRIPTYDDRERLLNIPIRRISRFDLSKNLDEIAALESRLKDVERHLKNIKKFTIKYLKDLIKKYGKNFPRRTEITTFGEIDRRAMSTKKVSVGYDPKSGFLGTKVSSEISIECTNYDKLLVMYADGSYHVINIPEKEFVHNNKRKVVYVGLADKETIINVAYRDPTRKQSFAKRFVVKKFILDREYRFIDDGMKLDYISTDKEPPSLQITFVPKPRQKTNKMVFSFGDVAVKGVSAKGIRVSPKEVKKVAVAKGSAKG